MYCCKYFNKCLHIVFLYDTIGGANKGGTCMNQIKKRTNPFERAGVVAEKPENITPATKLSHVVALDPAEREKYTATMDPNLRRRIKIACAMSGTMFSQFIEEACKEKLAREGVK